MSDQAIDYAKQRVLLIESSGTMRATIFYMLRNLGVHNIRAVTINNEVMSIIEEGGYDIILVGHNARDSVTGIQILEEARHKGLMKLGISWVFMTGDASQEVVLQAIDNQPEALLTKPFTVEELKARLDLLVARQSAMRDVITALDTGDRRAAVMACEKVPASSSHYEYAQQLKGQLLLELELYPEARRQLERCYWQSGRKEAGLLLVQALIEQEQLDDALKLLDELIDQYPLLIGAFDLKAQVLQRQGQLSEAENVLSEAVARAPLGIPRQMALGRLATQTRTLKIAGNAFKRSIILGRHSCLRSPEPYLGLANVRRLEIQGSEGKQQVSLRNEFDAILNTAVYQFPKEEALKVRSALLRSKLCEDLGEGERAQQHQKQAQLLNQRMDAPLDLQREALSVTGDPIPLAEPRKAPSAGTKQERDPAMSAKVNRLGVKHYLAGKYAQALRYFSMATEYDLHNACAQLNLAQLFLEQARDIDQKRAERLKMVDRYLRLTERMPLDDMAKAKQIRLKALRSKPLEQLPAGALGTLLR